MDLFSLFKKEDKLYFTGNDGFKFKNRIQSYKKIFSRLGIKFIELEENFCSGLGLLELGYELEARKHIRKNFNEFKINGIKKIITTSPKDYKAFKKDYPELLPDWDIEIIDLWELILKKLKNKPKLIKNKSYEEIAYHDSCYLGRYLGVYESPREILKILGYELKEFKNSRENSFCCGSCGNLPLINEQLSDEIAKERILQAKREGIKKIAVISLEDYEILKKNTKDIEILDFSELLEKALGIKRDPIIEKNNKEEIIKEDE